MKKSKNFGTYFQVINDFLDRGNYEKAAELCSEVHRLVSKSDSETHERLGLLYERIGTWFNYSYRKAALNCYKKTIELDSKCAYVHWAIADFCSDEKQRWKIAKRHYEICLKLIENKTYSDKMSRKLLMEIKNDATEGYEELLSKMEDEKFLKQRRK